MIKTFQKRFDIQNKELAELLGCSLSSIQKWRSGEVYPPKSVEKLIKLFFLVFDQNRTALFQWNHYLQQTKHGNPGDHLVQLAANIPKAHPDSGSEAENLIFSNTCLHLIRDMLFCTDLSGRIFFASPSLSRTLGYSPEQLLHQHFSILLPQADRNQAEQILCNATEGTMSIFNFSMVTNQGASLPVEAEVFFDTWEETCAMIWRAKETSCEQYCHSRSELTHLLNYKTALNRMIDAMSLHADSEEAQIITILSTLGLFTGADHAYLFCFGKQKKNIRLKYQWSNNGQCPDLPHSFEGTVKPDDWWFNSFCNRQTISIPDIDLISELPSYQQKLLRSTGSLSLFALPVFFKNSLLGFIELTCSARQKFWTSLQKELAHRTAKISAQILQIPEAGKGLFAHQNNHIGCLWGNSETDTLYCGRSLLELLGQQEATSTLSLNWLKMMTHPDDQEPAQKQFNLFLSGKADSVEYEKRIKCQKGEWIPVKIKWVPLTYDEQQKPRQIIGFCTRISRDRQPQALPATLAENAAIMESEILNNIAHELFTPLNGILGVSQLLESDLPESERNEYVDHLRTSASRLTHIVQEILDITSISNGKFTLLEEPIDLEKVKNDLYSTFSNAAHRKGLSFSFDRSRKTPSNVLADEIRLRQTIVNLLENSLKFTAEGFVRVRFYFRPSGSNGLLTCCVRDSGIGIPEEHHEQIFTPFFQCDSSASRKFEGAGLGLAICKKLATLMGGSLSVKSRPDHGSLFIFRIPVGCSECAPLQPEKMHSDKPPLTISFNSP